MSSSDLETGFAPRWLHLWAVLTAAVTVVLLALGAIVTTFQVGMADPVWPTVPWHLLLIDWTEPNPGFVIEHSHRLAGYTIGCCVIVLTVGMLWSARSPWLRGLGVAALLGVIVQGLLGGFRVRLHALLGTNLAVIHGCFAQVVFSLLVSLAVLTSRRFALADGSDLPRLRRGSLVLTGLIFLQLIWGALVRHTNGALAQRLHFVTAFAVIATATWFAHQALASPAGRRLLGRTLLMLGVLLAVQVLLGVESWIGKYAGAAIPGITKPTVGQAATRVAHVLVGSFLLATSVVMNLLTHRKAVVAQTDSATYRTTGSDSNRSGILVPHLEGTV